MRQHGLTSFYTEPGERERMSCRVCGSECEVERDAWGPTCMAHAVFGKSVRHDHFFCRHSNKDWHREACALLNELQKTRSRRVRELIQKDLEEVLARGGLAGHAETVNDAPR